MLSREQNDLITRTGKGTPAGDLILLEDQDRALWNRDQIMEGLSLVERARVDNERGRPRRAGAHGPTALMTLPPPNSTTTARNTRNAPNRWFSFAPSMTRPATASEYITMPVATVVGGTLKL